MDMLTKYKVKNVLDLCRLDFTMKSIYMINGDLFVIVVELDQNGMPKNYSSEI